jgi:two-component system cell cycle sensor histidine kinase PleC
VPEQNVIISADAEQARLDLISDNFARGRWELAGWVVVVMVVSSGYFPTIAPGITTGLVIWSAYQIFVAFCMHMAMKAWMPGNPTGWWGMPRREGYIGLHMLVGLGWGAFPFVSLHPGSIPALAATAVVMISVSAVQTARLSPHPPTYIAATLSLFLVGMPALAMWGSELGLIFSIAAPLWIFMVSTAALSLSNRIGQMIETRLENERLAAGFAIARDEALAASHAKSAFLANMSHELRTPLNAIIGFSDVMKTGLFGELNGRYQEYAEDIFGSGSHLLALVNDLLDLARIEAGRMGIEPQVFDAAEVLDQVSRFVELKAAGKRQTITLDIEPGAELLNADPRAFKQIALNLAANAVKFTQEGGRIAIALSSRGSSAVLKISDNGPGIPASKLTSIFNPFERVDDTYSGASGGTGLGLALVQALAKLHGGHPRIDSQLGQGTAVSVHLPDCITVPASFQRVAA